MTEEEQSLIAEIEAAFDGVALEDGISLNMTEYHDSGGFMPNYAELAKADERVNWQAIPDSTLENFTVTFCFTDLKGFRFYLPAYMRWCVRNCKSDCFIGEHTINALTPHQHLFVKTAFQEWFSERQFAVILRFLRFAAANGDTDAARSLTEFAK